MPPPDKLALFVGLVSSSYFTFGNISTYYMGVMPAIKRTHFHIADRLAILTSTASVAALHMGGASALTCIAISLATYLSPEPALQKLLFAGAVVACLQMPITRFAVVPINNELHRLANSTRQNDAESAAGKEEATHALGQVDRWRALHRIRMTISIFPWLCIVGALAAPDSIKHWFHVVRS
ncbi:hypothetical protein C8J57DRAFT_1317658 [Mycena rebaudengoi]|nr:hypothetical protein C8J57DRAFT_1317658 [Mycena rebaudengoi]